MNFYKDNNGIVWSILNETTMDLEATLKRHLLRLSNGKILNLTLYPVILNNKAYMVFMNAKGRIHYYKENVYNLGTSTTVQFVHCRQNNQRQQITVGILNNAERLEIIKLAIRHNKELIERGYLR